MKNVISNKLYQMRIIVSLLLFISLTLVVSADDEQRFTWGDIFNHVTIRTATYNPVNQEIYAVANRYEILDRSTRLINVCLLSSKDYGITWNIKNVIPKMFTSFYISFLRIDSKGNIYYYDYRNGIFYRSIDDGNTFEAILNFEEIEEIKDFRFNSKDEILIVGESHNIFNSKDHGSTWDTIKTDFEIRSLYINTNDDIYLLSEPIRTYNELGKYRNNKELNSSYNKLFYLDKNKKEIQEILTSDSIPENRKVFLSITEKNDSLCILSANEYYYLYDAFLDESYENPSLIMLDKSKEIAKVNILNLNKFSTVIDRSSTTICYGIKNNFFLCWAYDLYSYDLISEEFHILKEDLGGYYARIRLNSYEDSNIIFFDGDYGYTYMSKNYGLTWDYVNINRPKILPFTNVFMHRDSTQIILDSYNGVFMIEDIDITYYDITSNLDRKMTFTCFAETPNGNLIVGTEENGIFYRNNDGIWEQRNGTLKNFNINSITDGPDGELYICTDEALYICEDECLNFKVLYHTSCKEVVLKQDGLFLISNNGDLHNLSISNGQLTNEAKPLQEYYVTSLAINSQDVIIASTINNGVFKSIDNGKTWESANNELWSPIIYQVISTKDDEFIALAQTGIFLSNNNGEIWEKNYYKLAYKSEHSHINIENDFRLIKLRNDQIYYFYPGFSNILKEISSKPVEEQTGWEDQGKYFLQKSGFSSSTIRFSKNGEYLFAYSQSSHYNDYEYLHKYDYKTGKKLEERLIPFYSYANTILDLDDYGNFMFFAKYPISYNDSSFKQHIFIYNIYKDSILSSFNIYNSDSLTIDRIFARFDTVDEKIIMHIGYYDYSKPIDDNYSFGEYQIRNFMGDILYEEKVGFTTSCYFSNDRSFLVFWEYEFKRDSSNNDISFISEVSLKLINVKNNEIFDLDINDLFKQNGIFKFSENNKYLVYSYNEGLNSNEELNNFFVFNLDSLSHSKTNKYQYGLDSIFNVNSRINWDFLNNNEIICHGKTIRSPINEFFSIDILKNIITRKSKKPFLDVRDGIIVVSPDEKSFIIGTNLKFLIDDILSLDVVDFWADKQNCSTGDTITFTANLHSYSKNIMWDFGDGSYGKEEILTHIYQNPGQYSVKLFYKNGDRLDSVVKIHYISVDDVTDVRADELNNIDIFIYPNPTDNIIKIESSNIIDNIKMVNMFGNTVKELIPSAFANEAQFQIEDLPPGVYMISIYCQGKIISRKVVVF
jgi:PKD repeat protein